MRQQHDIEILERSWANSLAISACSRSRAQAASWSRRGTKTNQVLGISTFRPTTCRQIRQRLPASLQVILQGDQDPSEAGRSAGERARACRLQQDKPNCSTREAMISWSFVGQRNRWGPQREVPTDRWTTGPRLCQLLTDRRLPPRRKKNDPADQRHRRREDVLCADLAGVHEDDLELMLLWLRVDGINRPGSQLLIYEQSDLASDNRQQAVSWANGPSASCCNLRDCTELIRSPVGQITWNFCASRSGRRHMR